MFYTNAQYSPEEVFRYGRYSKLKQRNVLLLGTGETTSFINTCEASSKWFQLQEYPSIFKTSSRTTGITEKYITFFDEQLCFIDTPESFEVQNLYQVLISFNVLDAILVFSDCYLTEFKSLLQKFFTATNYPREKIIFILPTPPKYVNNLKIIANLENSLVELQLTTKIVLNNNLFLIGSNIYDSNEMLKFRYALKNLFIQQPCVFQLIVDPYFFNIITDVHSLLIEVLQTLTDLTDENLGMFLSLLSVEDQRTICKTCIAKEPKKVCKFLNEELCPDCSCPLEEHLRLNYYIVRQSYREKWSWGTGKHTKTEFEIERFTILHMVAILYLFCKRSGLMDVHQFNKEYWSLVKQQNITRDDPIYKEIETKVTELASNLYFPTPEEVMFLLESLEKEKWCSFDAASGLFRIGELVKANCTLKFVVNKNPSKPNKSLKFPEMKTKLPNNSGDNATKELLEADLQNLRREVDELKVAINEEKSEKEFMRGQLDDLKRKIEEIMSLKLLN